MPLDFACPHCRGPLEHPGPDIYVCQRDALTFPREKGIWRFLPPDRQAYYARFIREYETVRRAEGRGSADPAYFRSLPFRDLSGKMARMWRLRAASFHTFYRRIVTPLHATRGKLHILDLGAGSGWLSYRLANDGHDVYAVDLLTNDWDGLGAIKYYDAGINAIQAEYDALPFGEAFFDMIIFNASYHYSTNYFGTLENCLRLLSPTGSIAILDTPVYHDPESGARMVREREAQFTEKFGFPSNALRSENYLTFKLLQGLTDSLGLNLRLYSPRFGLRWKLRNLWLRARGHREPASFPIIQWGFEV